MGAAIGFGAAKGRFVRFAALGYQSREQPLL
jgi:hypothetical protein